MARAQTQTQEYASLEDMFGQSTQVEVPEQWQNFDEVAYIESLPEAYFREDSIDTQVSVEEDVPAVSCLESIRIAAEQRYEANYDKLKRHEYRAIYTFPEAFSDIDKLLNAQQADQSVRITVSDAEEQVMQAYKDASVHTVIRKVISGEETDIEAVRDHLQSSPVSDGAKVSIAKTFVEHIVGEIKATHEADTTADKQLHARQSLLLTDLAKDSIGHVAISSEKEANQPVGVCQEFDFLKQVSHEPVEIADYNVRPRSRFTKKVTQLALGSFAAAFSIQPIAATSVIESNIADALIQSSPISAGMAEKLIDAVSDDEQDDDVKATIAAIVSPYEAPDKLVAASNVKLLNEAVKDEIRQKTGKEPAETTDIPDSAPVGMYVMVADSVVAESGPQMPEADRQLLTDYADFMKTVASNADNLPDGLAAIIIDQAPAGYVTTLRDLAVESATPGSAAEVDKLMATMYANLDAIVHPTVAEQDKLLAEIMNNQDQSNPETPTPPAVPQPAPPEVAPTPPPIEAAPTDEIASKLTHDAMAGILKGAPRENIEKYTSLLLNALKEQNIYDVQMVAYALGTINAETAAFAPIPEYASGEAYEGREDLGNIHPGDGMKYKGRGFIQLTGRANYRHYGEKLGIDLEGNPDLALDPTIAARILALYLNGKSEKIRHALVDHKDLALARKYVNGGTNGLQEMSDGYLATLAVFGIVFEEAEPKTECDDKIKHAVQQVKKDLLAKYECVSGNLAPEELVQLGGEWGDNAINPIGLAGFKNMALAFQTQFGKSMTINDSYRSFDEQVETKKKKEAEGKPNQAATPGTSQHGWGFAIDFGGGINRFGTTEHEWMKANAERFGWAHPSWAQADGNNPEPWHWEYVGGGAESEETAPQMNAPIPEQPQSETVQTPSPAPVEHSKPSDDKKDEDQKPEKIENEPRADRNTDKPEDDKNEASNTDGKEKPEQAENPKEQEDDKDKKSDKKDDDERDKNFVSSITGLFTD